MERKPVEILPPARRDPPAELGCETWDELVRKLRITTWTEPCRPTAAVLKLAAERAGEMAWLYGRRG